MGCGNGDQTKFSTGFSRLCAESGISGWFRASQCRGGRFPPAADAGGQWFLGSVRPNISYLALGGVCKLITPIKPGSDVFSLVVDSCVNVLSLSWVFKSGS